MTSYNTIYGLWLGIASYDVAPWINIYAWTYGIYVYINSFTVKSDRFRQRDIHISFKLKKKQKKKQKKNKGYRQTLLYLSVTMTSIVTEKHLQWKIDFRIMTNSKEFDSGSGKKKTSGGNFG